MKKMMMKHLNKIILSIIVPVYNGAAYIDALVKMVVDQNFDALELILVDDGSVDNTYELCLKHADIHDWIHVIHTENHGVSHARNTGLAAASGEWIQFLDVDDVIEPGMLQGFYDIAAVHNKIGSNANGSESVGPMSDVINPEKKVVNPETDLVICGCNRFHGTAAPVSCGPKTDGILAGEEYKQLFNNLEMEDRYWLLDYCWNKWYRKSLIDQYQVRFDEKLSLGEDFVFNATYVKHVKEIALLKTCFYQYRVGAEGLASRFQPEPWNSRRFLYEAQKELYQSLGLWESNKQKIAVHYGQILFGDIRTINSKKCSLSKQEKSEYIENMAASPMFSMILSYLKEKKSPVFKVYHFIFRLKNKRWILALIQLESRMRKS